MYNETEARELVIKAGHKLIENKLIARTWGNISARISDTEFVITPSGRAYETLRPEELVKVSADTLEYDGKIKPSSEKGIHAAAYKLRPDCDFVIHTHQFYASAVCAEGKDTGFAPCAKYGLSGTKKLAANVADVIQANPEKKMFLMSNHGALVTGNSFEEAFALAGELEENCKKLFDDNRHEPYRGSWLDDYAQMFDSRGKPGDTEDASAVEMVRQKNEAAASYVTTARPIPGLVALLEHTVYRKKYSKLKGK